MIVTVLIEDGHSCTIKFLTTVSVSSRVPVTEHGGRFDCVCFEKKNIR